VKESCGLSFSGRKAVPAFDCRAPSDRSRLSILAIFWYAQCVVLKYDGTRGAGLPSKSRSRNRVMELRAEWYVDIAACGVDSQVSARDL
jgi:hypothetical protein